MLKNNKEIAIATLDSFENLLIQLFDEYQTLRTIIEYDIQGKAVEQPKDFIVEIPKEVIEQYNNSEAYLVKVPKDLL